MNIETMFLHYKIMYIYVSVGYSYQISKVQLIAGSVRSAKVNAKYIMYVCTYAHK